MWPTATRFELVGVVLPIFETSINFSLGLEYLASSVPVHGAQNGSNEFCSLATQPGWNDSELVRS